MKLNGINDNEEETITDPTLLMEVSGSTHKRLVFDAIKVQIHVCHR